MMTVTMLSLKAVWRFGSAASRSIMVEYWFWSAMQKTMGSGDLKNGAQNSSIGAGRDTRQTNAAPTANTTSNAAYSLREPLRSELSGIGICCSSERSASSGNAGMAISGG